jgi:large subunit ribosomal protein LP0
MPKQESKEKIFNKIHENLGKFKQVLVCEIKDLPADFIHKIRKLLRNINSEVVCGKTTVMTKAFQLYIEGKNFATHHNKEGLTAVKDAIFGMQTLLIFTNEEVSKITEITGKFVIEKQAKTGAISPIEVTLQAGPTGMDSSQIEYFQALKIPTKVIKNQLEIVASTKILVVGQKISMSEINLMKKFNIKPYKHYVQIMHIYMNGKLYDAGILKITPDYMKERLSQGIRNIAAFGLSTGITNKASAPHVIGNAFRNILGLSLSTGLEISQAKGLLTASAAPKEEKKVEKVVEKKKEPEPEEEDVGGFGDIFG